MTPRHDHFHDHNHDRSHDHPMTAPEVFALFPTPLMHVPHAASAELVARLRAQFAARADVPNQRHAELAHTAVLDPAGEPLLIELAHAIGVHVVDFGALIFGQRLRWAIKEMWLNVLQTGGQQSLHAHANSFVSGVLYLSQSDPSAHTVFVRALGGGPGYIFKNTHAEASLGPFNADKWVAPVPAPGDLLLFPSHLLHEVPANRGVERITLAFNAIPHRLDAWGYAIEFSA